MLHQILLVDDSATVSQLIRLAVADEGIEVAVAANLASAREILIAGRPDLILVDASLPDGDGYAFCSEIKSTDGAIPVLLIASVQQPIDAERARAAGADGTLTKPFQSIGALLDTFKSLMAGSRPLSEIDDAEPAPRIDVQHAIARDTDDILELDEMLFAPPMNSGAFPSSNLPLTDAQIETLAERVAAILEERLRRDVVSAAIPETMRIVLERIAEKSCDADANPTRDIDEA
jgi:DNA-binding response OmpR family regulator